MVRIRRFGFWPYFKGFWGRNENVDFWRKLCSLSEIDRRQNHVFRSLQNRAHRNHILNRS
jgi:hypothetical protein